MDLVHELCPLQLLEVTKKSDTWAGWFASIQHLAHMCASVYIIVLRPKARWSLLPFAKCLWSIAAEELQEQRSAREAHRGVNLKFSTQLFRRITEPLKTILQPTYKIEFSFNASGGENFLCVYLLGNQDVYQLRGRINEALQFYYWWGLYT